MFLDFQKCVTTLLWDTFCRFVASAKASVFNRFHLLPVSSVSLPYKRQKNRTNMRIRRNMQYVENHSKQSRLFAPPLSHSLKQMLCNLDCSCTVRLLTTVPGTISEHFYQINIKYIWKCLVTIRGLLLRLKDKTMACILCKQISSRKLSLF